MPIQTGMWILQGIARSNSMANEDQTCYREERCVNNLSYAICNDILKDVLHKASDLIIERFNANRVLTP